MFASFMQFRQRKLSPTHTNFRAPIGAQHKKRRNMFIILNCVIKIIRTLEPKNRIEIHVNRTKKRLDLRNTVQDQPASTD